MRSGMSRRSSVGLAELMNSTARADPDAVVFWTTVGLSVALWLLVPLQG